MIYKIQQFFNLLFKTLASLLKILFLTRFGIKIACPQGKSDCTILGNGPSLTDTLQRNPEFLASSTLFCVNFFANTELFEKMKPERYVIAAPETWLPSLNESLRNLYIKLFENIAQKTTWQLYLYLPSIAKKSDLYRSYIQQSLSDNKNIEVFFFNTTPVEGFKFASFRFFRWNWGMPRPHNVFIPSLVIAIFAKKKKQSKRMLDIFRMVFAYLADAIFV